VGSVVEILATEVPEVKPSELPLPIVDLVQAPTVDVSNDDTMGALLRAVEIQIAQSPADLRFTDSPVSDNDHFHIGASFRTMRQIVKVCTKTIEAVFTQQLLGNSPDAVSSNRKFLKAFESDEPFRNAFHVRTRAIQSLQLR
jgi:hypothetical protein